MVGKGGPIKTWLLLYFKSSCLWNTSMPGKKVRAKPLSWHANFLSTESFLLYLGIVNFPSLVSEGCILSDSFECTDQLLFYYSFKHNRTN